jgi:hypothetical protein
MAKNGISQSPIDKLSIASVSDESTSSDRYEHATKSAEYMVRMDNLFQSTLQGYQQFTPAYDLRLSGQRLTNPNAVQDKKSSSRFVLENPVLVIPNSGHTASLFNYLISGNKVNMVSVVRLNNINGQNNIEVERYDFENANIETIRTDNDLLYVEFRATKVSLTYTDYNQDGTSNGRSVAAYDLTTGQPTTPSLGSGGAIPASDVQSTDQTPSATSEPESLA